MTTNIISADIQQAQEKNRSYGAWLINGDCMFDTDDGFPTAEAVIEWALDRGGRYVAQFFEAGSYGRYDVTATIDPDGIYVTDDNNAISFYTPQRFAAYLRRHL